MACHAEAAAKALLSKRKGLLTRIDHPLKIEFDPSAGLRAGFDY